MKPSSLPPLLRDEPVFAEVLGASGREVGDGEEGELVHCGPLVARGYWQDPDRTAEEIMAEADAAMFAAKRAKG